jgi:hypothetical protein
MSVIQISQTTEAMVPVISGPHWAPRTMLNHGSSLVATCISAAVLLTLCAMSTVAAVAYPVTFAEIFTRF